MAFTCANCADAFVQETVKLFIFGGTFAIADSHERSVNFDSARSAAQDQRAMTKINANAKNVFKILWFSSDDATSQEHRKRFHFGP